MSKWLAAEFNLAHISTGDLLRQAATHHTQMSRSLALGQLAADDMVMSELNRAIARQNDRVCLDGFPRRRTQAEAFDRIVTTAPLQAVYLIDIPETVLMERLSGTLRRHLCVSVIACADRWIHQASGRTYSYSFAPPAVPGRDNVTGEPLERRLDDSLTSFAVRMKDYHRHVSEISSFYQAKGILHVISGQQSTCIYDQIKRHWQRDCERREISV